MNPSRSFFGDLSRTGAVLNLPLQDAQDSSVCWKPCESRGFSLRLVWMITIPHPEWAAGTVTADLFGWALPCAYMRMFLITLLNTWAGLLQSPLVSCKPWLPWSPRTFGYITAHGAVLALLGFPFLVLWQLSYCSMLGQSKGPPYLFLVSGITVLCV